MPALSSAPSSVVPSVTIRCLPMLRLRIGKSSGLSTVFSFSAMSPPVYSTMRGLMSLPEQSGEVSIWAMRPMAGAPGVPGTEP